MVLVVFLLFLFVFVEFNRGSAKAVEMTVVVVLLACFVLLPCFSLRSLILPFPAALCQYLLPRLRVVSPVQQLSVPLQHKCSCCSLSDLASHSSELLSAFLSL